MNIKLPIPGRTYNYFDDGKVNPSRMYSVLITDVIPFSEIDKETLKFWEKEVEEYPWLYSSETPYFIKGDLYLLEDTIEDICFVRTIDDDVYWFSLGYWAGLLDVDGTLKYW